METIIPIVLAVTTLLVMALTAGDPYFKEPELILPPKMTDPTDKRCPQCRGQGYIHIVTPPDPNALELER